MPPKHQEAIEDVVPTIFEQMAFMFMDPAARDDLPSDPGGVLRVDISFTGDASGCLTLVTCRRMCDELAENLDASEHETEGGEQTEAEAELASLAGPLAIMELTNVACGQLLTAVAGNEPVFDLSPPKLSEQVGRQDWTRWLNDEEAVRFMADDYPLLIRFDFVPAA